MQIIIIRHAIAEDKDIFAETDRQDRYRPLTDRGRKKMKKNTKGLLEIVPEIAILASSPYTRAQQTTEIIQKYYSNLKVVENESLTPEKPPQEIIEWFSKMQTQYSNAAIVGHEPHLTGVIAAAVGTASPDFLILKTGGACSIRFIGTTVGPGQAHIEWVLPPAVLKKLA